MRGQAIWMYWLVMTLGVGMYFVYALKADEAPVYLIGDVTHAHHQIEMACSSCHSDSFGGEQVLQDACVKCHEQDLKAGDDSHPKSKFTDPRNADRVQMLDARQCVSCHTEHRPEDTRAIGVTLPDDFCVRCHQDIAEERPSHRDLKFSSCASAGCHNFHDNKALYEDFLLAHQNEPELLLDAQLPKADISALMTRTLDRPLTPLQSADADVPDSIEFNNQHLRDWSATAHADAGVNCMACHSQKETDSDQPGWLQKPDQDICAECHAGETEGFESGLHGMRRQAGLSPMRPALAQLPMQEKSLNHELSCQSCHGAHSFDVNKAAVEACMGCHNDEHSNSYPQSAHAQIWNAELQGTAPAGSGVSCASCHLPRTTHVIDGVTTVYAEHNQNKNLRPNEKMLRSVCMNCHGLAFSIDALGDPALIENNFSARPEKHIPSIDWAVKRHAEKSNSPSQPLEGSNP